MIKFSGTAKGDRKIIGLGLSAENIRRLKAGQPIHVDGEEFGVRGADIVIVYGETEDALYEQFRPLIGPDTRLEDTR